jgi:invasion protein IalB
MRRRWRKHAEQGIGFAMRLNGFADGYDKLP